MLAFQKLFLWLSKVFCLLFFPAISAFPSLFKARLVTVKNIFTRLQRNLSAMNNRIFKIIQLTMFIMKKCISYTASFRLQYVFAVLMMLLSGFPLMAQENGHGEESLVLAFDSPFSYTLREDVSWELKDESGSVILSRRGDVSRHIFSRPGTYTLHIHEDRDHDTGSCEHAHFPEKVKIEVKPAKVDFDFSTLRFSKDIIGGQPANGITVTVSVNYSSYDNSTAIYNLGFGSFGVGSTITGKLKNNEVILKSGVNTIEFIVEGQAEAGNNIQLNFTDFNGDVQPYLLTPKMQ